MKRILFLYLFVFLAINFATGQYYTNQNKVWAFGYHAGVDFTSGSPSAISTMINQGEGSASVCDATGTLLFYTDGRNVYNRTGSLMPHGNAFFSYGVVSTTQPAVIVPVIGNANQYYLFSLEQCCGSGHLAYSIVDMTLDGGNGDVVTTVSAISMGTGFSERMTAVAGNSCDVWLLTHRKDSAVFWAYDISSAGISSPTISNVGSFSGSNSYEIGVLKASPNRVKLVAQVYTVGSGHGTELYDFDPTTGTVSNCQVLNSTTSNYGAEFSPDNTKLYTEQWSAGSVVQYDISLSSTSAIIASATTVVSGSSAYGDLKLAPDGKIYLSNSSSGFLDCFSTPNGSGSLCGFTSHAVTLASGTHSTTGLPNIFFSLAPNDSVFVRHDTTACVPIGGGISLVAHDSGAVGCGYLWDNGSTARTRSVSSAGTYLVRIFNGCHLIVDTIHVTFYPVIGAISGSGGVCTGSLILLSDTSSGTWSISNAAATIGSTSGFVSGISPGLDTVKYTAATGCYVTKVITVNSLPGIISGPTNVCAGLVISLLDTPSGGVWSTAGTSTISIGSATGLVTGGSAGVATVTYTTTAGCSRSGSVTVNPLPAGITGSLNVCVGATTGLFDATPGGVWRSVTPAIASIGSTSGLVSGLFAGSCQISYTLPTGCTVTGIVTVNGMPLPPSGVLDICPGSSSSLYASPPGGTWTSSSPGVAAFGSLTGSCTGISTGTAGITYTLPTGCASVAIATVEPLPAPIGGPLALCSGGTTTLTDATASGYWISSDIATAYIDIVTGVTTGYAIGTATITYTDPFGCFVTADVTVNSAPTAIAGTTTVCQGASQILFDGVSGGAWSSSNTGVATIGSTSGNYTGVSVGTAVINYSTGSGCTVSTTVTVLAAPAAITGTLNVCPAGNTVLSAGSGSGTWSTTSSRIALSGSTGSTMTVTGVSAGTAVVTYTTGCFTTATVTVNAVPTITGTLNVCPNSSTTLTTGVSGTWSSSNTSIATISSTGLLTGVTSGTVTVTFIAATTGCSARVVATVNPLPAAITGPGTVCTGQAVSLSSSPSGGIWTKSNSSVSVSSSGLTLGVTAGTAVVTYTLPVTGCYATKTISVFTTPAAITGTTNVCVGGATTLTTTTGGGTWSSGSSATMVSGSGTTATITGIAAGTSVISYTMSSGCAATATVTVNSLPAPFTVTGGGGICAGGSGLHIGLSGSAAGTTYALYRGGTATGTTLAGTGSSIDFGPQTVGNYTVIATGSTSGCTNNMTGSVTVSLNPTPVVSGPTAVCSGTSVTLTATPAGTWSSSNLTVAIIGSSSGIITGLTIGVVSITCFPTGGCSSTVTINVTSGPGAITGPTGLCVGTSTTLSVTPAGGVWTSSNIPVAAIGSADGVLTGRSAGIASITYSLGGSCYTTASITVSPSPAGITGTMSICEGSTTTLSNTTAGGSWSGSTSVAVISGSGGTATVYGATAGTATISYTVSGCSSTAVVTVNAVPPLIGGPASLCQGTTATETNTMSAGVWTTSSAGIGITGVGTTATITGTSSGVGTITYNVSGCSTVKSITVNTAPTITGTRTLCTGNSTTLTTGVSGAWSSGASSIATITASGLVNAISAGTAPITFTPPTGCIAITTITVNSTPPPITGPTNVCAGSTTAYTAAGGTWVSSSPAIATIGSASGILTAISPGAVTITCPPTGCSSSLTITVNPLPAAITGSSSSVCVGASASLASTTPGGTWGSSNTSFATVGSTTGIVSGINAGSANISYTVNGCSVAKAMTVTAVPSISGPNKVCLGSTITLTPGTTGGTWSSSNPVVAAVGSASGVVNGASLGNATISYSLGPGCTMTTGMTVDPLPAAISGGSNICVGRTTTLSDATPGGAWSSGTAFASVNSATGVVTGIAGGAALISYIGLNGCASTATINVIQLQPITGVRALCAWGDTMRVANADTTGTYTSTFATVLNIGHGGGIVTARVPGISSVTYTIPLGCSITAQVTVNPLPAGISGTLNLCPGGTGVLSDVSPGGTWSSATPAVASIGGTSGTATAVAAGTTRIIYTLPTGCKTDTLLTVTAPPVAGTITGRNNLCVGSTTLLAAGAGGGAWSSGVPSVATISTTGVVTGIATGTATIAYSISNLCGTDAAQATVNVYPAVTAGTITGLDTICAGNSTILADTATGGAWAGTNTSIASIGSMGEVLGLLAGTDTITYRVANPGCSVMAMHTIEVLPHAICGLNTGAQSETSQQFQVWPNPNDGSFTVRLTSPFNEEVQISISDVAGRAITEKSTTTNTDLGVTTLRPGIYLLRAQTSHGNYISKVVIR